MDRFKDKLLSTEEQLESFQLQSLRKNIFKYCKKKYVCANFRSSHSGGVQTTNLSFGRSILLITGASLSGIFHQIWFFADINEKLRKEWRDDLLLCLWWNEILLIVLTERINKASNCITSDEIREASHP